MTSDHKKKILTFQGGIAVSIYVETLILNFTCANMQTDLNLLYIHVSRQIYMYMTLLSVFLELNPLTL